MARRVDVVREYLLKEHDLDLPEEYVIKNFCPTAIRYGIYKLGIHIDKNTCITNDCTDCWNEEMITKRIDLPLQEGDILKKIDGKWCIVSCNILSLVIIYATSSLLYDNYKNFCDNQENCIRCLLQQEELIYEAYDQPCSTIYALLKIIQEG